MNDMSPIGDATNEKYEQVLRVNTFGPSCAMRKAVNVFLEQGNGGTIVNVASLGAMRSCAGDLLRFEGSGYFHDKEHRLHVYKRRHSR